MIAPLEEALVGFLVCFEFWDSGSLLDDSSSLLMLRLDDACSAASSYLNLCIHFIIIENTHFFR